MGKGQLVKTSLLDGTEQGQLSIALLMASMANQLVSWTLGILASWLPFIPDLAWHSPHPSTGGSW